VWKTEACAIWECTRLARFGHSPDGLATIRLLADVNQAGEAVHEELPARPLDTGIWQLLSSPGLVFDVAADDVVRVDGDGRFEILERGGNARRHGEEWYYGNVYDDQDQPLNWWVE
jgi:hypothetical protein